MLKQSLVYNQEMANRNRRLDENISPAQASFQKNEFCIPARMADLVKMDRLCISLLVQSVVATSLCSGVHIQYRQASNGLVKFFFFTHKHRKTHAETNSS